jgi:hypothetical protein
LNIAVRDPDAGSILWKTGAAKTVAAPQAIQTPLASIRLQQLQTFFLLSSFTITILPRVNI